MGSRLGFSSVGIIVLVGPTDFIIGVGLARLKWVEIFELFN